MFLSAALAAASCGDRAPAPRPNPAAAPSGPTAEERAERFAGRLAGADRVLVFSGDLESRENDPPEGRLLLEVARPQDVREFVALFRFEPGPDRPICDCRGGPWFRASRGQVPCATFSLHHESTIRGEGPGDAEALGADAALTEASADALCGWLDARGIHEPAASRKDAARLIRIGEAVDARRREILGANAQRRAAATDDVGAVERLLRETFPDARARAVVALRVLGSARQYDNDAIAEAAFLTAADADVRSSVVDLTTKPVADDELLRGLGLWILRGVARFRLDLAYVRRIGPAFEASARRVLADDEAFARADAVEGLRRLATPEAAALLREVLSGRVRRVPGAAPTAFDAATVASVVEILAFHLADVESLPRIRELAADATSPEHAKFAEAERWLVRVAEKKR
jgi:hypothetical protein